MNVEARNHYYYINRILEKNESSSKVYTNFKNILKDKIEREIEFIYVSKITKASLSKIERTKSYLFIRTNRLENETRLIYK